MSRRSTPTQKPGDPDEEIIEWAGPSKSQLKRDAHKIQDLGIELTQLKPEQLATIPLSSSLESALNQVKSIKKNEALRRHHQLIGKLMRSADTEAIEEALNKIKEAHDRETRMTHAMEQWRDNLIKEDQSFIGKFIDQYPGTDRQQIRHLVQGAKKELAIKKPPVNARKLFKFIREVMTQTPEED